VNRLTGQRGLCGETGELRLAKAGLHFGEEPPLTGGGGSGTIFIGGCSMNCPFCQNYQISRSAQNGSGMGRVVNSDEFTEICTALRNEGAENINLVTPSHMAPTLVSYLKKVRKAGVMLPVAWNSSGFESSETVKMASEIVDIWLPDLKTLDDAAARRIYGIKKYPESAAAAIMQMADFGNAEFDDEGRMIRGLMVRHLMLPGELESTRGVLAWFSANQASTPRVDSSSPGSIRCLTIRPRIILPSSSYSAFPKSAICIIAAAADSGYFLIP